jgi:hypothetical protein
MTAAHTRPGGGLAAGPEAFARPIEYGRPSRGQGGRARFDFVATDLVDLARCAPRAT